MESYQSKKDNCSPIHTITTHYSLQEAQLCDAAIIYQVVDNHREYLKTWLPFVCNLNIEGEEVFLSSMLSTPYEERNIVFMIKKSNELCGLVGFANTDITNHRTEIGYWLLPEHQGKGIMTQCVKYLCQWSIEKEV